MINTNRIINDNVPGLFEVYSIVSGKSLSKPLAFTYACDEMDNIAETNGAGNGIDIRR